MEWSGVGSGSERPQSGRSVGEDTRKQRQRQRGINLGSDAYKALRAHDESCLPAQRDKERSRLAMWKASSSDCLPFNLGWFLLCGSFRFLHRGVEWSGMGG